MLPVMHAHQDARLRRGQRCERIEVRGIEAERLLDDDVSTGFERGARSLRMKGRRTGDIEKIKPLAGEHQLEVIVDPDVLDQAERQMPSL